MNWQPAYLKPTRARLKSLILFGSHARGEQDQFSDVDVCAFIEDIAFEDLVFSRQEMSSQLGVPLDSLSIYTVPVVEQMRDRGSLFLWHLRLEGKVLCDNRGFATSVLEDLPVFTAYDEELSHYRDLWFDVREALRVHDSLNEFDYHILHGIVRDCCILLCYEQGNPVFGRTSAFESASHALLSFPIDRSSFLQLTSWHLAYLRNAPPEFSLPQASVAWEMVNKVGEVLDLCETLLLSKRQTT